MTVREAVEAGLKRDLLWDWGHRIISINKPPPATAQ
jgi:hypothetical protein